MNKAKKNTDKHFKEPRYYYCYSLKQSAYLFGLGFKAIYRDIHKKSKKIFWVFPATEELSKALTD